VQSGAGYRVRPVLPTDMDGLYALGLELFPSWLRISRTLASNPQTFSAALWRNVIVQQVVVDAGDHFCGLLALHDPDLLAGTAWADYVQRPDLDDDFLPVVREAAAGVERLARQEWNLRRLYHEAPEYAPSVLVASGGWEHLYSVPADLYSQGTYWDRHIYVSELPPAPASP